MNVHPAVFEIAHEFADEMAAQGAMATLLMGSHVRGEAHAESDVDLTFIGRDEECILKRRGGHLVSLYWRSPESVEGAMHDPAAAGGVVPGLRGALIVRDPDGVASQLKARADSWNWAAIDKRCDAWVAGQISGYAEEVHRLVGCVGNGNLLMAAVVRDVLAIRMAPTLSVHLRVLYDSENKLWHLVGQEMGEGWSEVQGKALGMSGESFPDTCDAAMELYAISAACVIHLLSVVQREVVEHACAMVGHAIGSVAD